MIPELVTGWRLVEPKEPVEVGDMIWQPLKNNWIDLDTTFPDAAKDKILAEQFYHVARRV